MRFICAVVVICSMVTVSARSQGPPINTDTPMMLGVDGRGVRSFGKTVRMATLRDNGTAITDTLDRKVTVWTSLIVVPYNVFSDRLQFGVIVPVRRASMSRKGKEITNTGLGEVRLFTKYSLYQFDRRNQTVRIAAKVTVKLPTADERESPSLGTGSTDFLVSTVIGWIKNRIGIYGEGIYALNGTDQLRDYGNSVAYNVAVGYRLLPTVYRTYPSPQLNLFLELNGVTSARGKMNGTTIESSGGTTLFLSPGIQYVGGRRWLVESSFQYPIVNEPNGIQLALDWTLSFGFRVLVF